MIAGLFACVFGILGIVTFWPLVFVPLAVAFALMGIIVAIVRRSGSAGFVAGTGGLLAGIGFVTSPSLWIVTALLMAAHPASQEASVEPASSAPLPASFAWRKGESPPAGVTADADGMPDGYEMQSGAAHGCYAPGCLWFVRQH